MSLPELPFCIVVSTFNNVRDFRYKYNLQSIANLRYSNLRVVITDDASDDGTFELISQWVQRHGQGIDFVLLRNEKRMTVAPNIFRAVHSHCQPDAIVVVIDGDDELLGRLPLKVFNHVYRTSDMDFVYSTCLQYYRRDGTISLGWSFAYSEEEKRGNKYREVAQKTAHLKSFKASLFKRIREEDFKDNDGNWFTTGADEAFCLPIL